VANKNIKRRITVLPPEVKQPSAFRVLAASWFLPSTRSTDDRPLSWYFDTDYRELNA